MKDREAWWAVGLVVAESWTRLGASSLVAQLVKSLPVVRQVKPHSAEGQDASWSGSGKGTGVATLDLAHLTRHENVHWGQREVRRGIFQTKWPFQLWAQDS